MHTNKNTHATTANSCTFDRSRSGSTNELDQASDANSSKHNANKIAKSLQKGFDKIKRHFHSDSKHTHIVHSPNNDGVAFGPSSTVTNLVVPMNSRLQSREPSPSYPQYNQSKSVPGNLYNGISPNTSSSTDSQMFVDRSRENLNNGSISGALAAPSMITSGVPPLNNRTNKPPVPPRPNFLVDMRIKLQNLSDESEFYCSIFTLKKYKI